MAGNLAFKRWVSAVALMATVWTGMSWGAPAVSAAANPFSDVKPGHWAEKHVTKLALQGVISGKGNGLFDPSGSIRREDAVIMALKFIGYDGGNQSGGIITLPSSLQVDTYAVGYVQEAINRKLLYIEEEAALAEQEKGKHWGKTYASREWVARLLVRAIGKEAEASANAGKSTAFIDDANIDPKYKPYVVTAVENGLIAGIAVPNSTSMKFDPKAEINRASIATLLSKAASHINAAYSGQVSGVLLGMSEGKLTVLHQEGSIREYAVGADAMFARFDSDKPVDASDLKLYGKVTLIHDGSGSIGYVEQMDNQTYITTVDGTYTQYSSSRNSVYLTVGDVIQEYFYDPHHVPAVKDSQGNTIKLDEIPANTPVTLKVDTLRTSPKIVEILVKQSVVNKNDSGVVTEWNPATGEMTVSDVETGEIEKWKVSPAATYKQDDTFVNADQLKTGYTVFYEVKAGVVTSIQFAKPALTTVTGKFYDVDESKGIFTFFQDGKITSKLLSASPKVIIQGMTDAGLDDLQEDDDITVTIDGNDKVTQIAVNNRSVQFLTGATIKAYISDIKQLTLQDVSGKVHNFALTNNVRYDMNGVDITATQAASSLTAGKKVTVAYSGDQAITIYFIAKYTGTVLEHNTTSKTLKIQVDANNIVTLPYMYPALEIYGQTTSTYTDVKVGDKVTVVLNSNQDQIGSIQVQKNAQLEIVSVDAANSKINLRKAGSSTTETFYLSTLPVIQDENGATLTLSQLTAGTVANVTFMGRTTIEKIKTVSVTYGEVVSVDTANQTINISLPGGVTVSKTAGTSPLIIRGQTTSTSLASVLPGERVEVRKDENDRTVIEVVTPVNKQFWKYNASAGSIEVRRATLTENNVYKLETDTYIHQGTTKITASQLKEGDPISIYILRGKVVEISK